MRKEGEMQEIMIVGIILFMSMQFMPSLAQQEQQCWRRIITCIEDNQTPIKFQQECCPSFLQEMETDKECFCSIKPLLLQNVTLDAVVSNLLSLCSITTSFNTICPGPTRSPSGIVIRSPPGPAISPTRTPFPSPSAEEKEDDLRGNCWVRIEKCTTNATSSSSPTAFLECCPMIQEEIETERECFCSIRNRIRDKPTALNALTRLFTVCSLPGSFDSVCPVASSSRGGTAFSPSIGPPLSPTETLFPSSPGSTSGTNQNSLPPPPGGDSEDNLNESSSNNMDTNKIVFSIELLLTKALLFVIWAIIIVS